MRKLLVLFGAAAVVLAATPAAAVGVADVDMNVMAPRADDGRRHVHAAGESATVPVVLRNLADEARTVTLSIRGGTIDAETGSLGLGGEDAAAWLGFSPREITLAAGERQTIDVLVDPAAVPRGEGDTIVAFVLAAPQGEVVTQAASIVRITAEAPPPPWALWLIALALLLLVTTALVREWRKRRVQRLPGVPVPA